MKTVKPAPEALPDLADLPAVKFFKDAVDDILTGRKTLEPRPRSAAWGRRIAAADRIRLTYGPRYGAPTVFAVAKVLSVETRPFATATQADVDRIGYGWLGRDPADFVEEYTAWYAKELAKGYPVVWITFAVAETFSRGASSVTGTPASPR
ncbi:ASCH domain-containing protein [Kitasatospora sp. NPDC054939]